MNFKHTDETIFNKLIEKLKTGKYKSISISGGGDPLFNFGRNINWFSKLFNIMSDQFPDIKIKLHTTYLNLHDKLDLSKFYLISYHVNFNTKLFPKLKNYKSKYDIKSCRMDLIKRYPNIINRVVFVVEKYFTPSLIDEIYNYFSFHPNIDQLTFRQLIDKDYNAANICDEYLTEGHNLKKWYYVKQGDYNEYLTMNEYSTKFKKFTDIEEI